MQAVHVALEQAQADVGALLAGAPQRGIPVVLHCILCAPRNCLQHGSIVSNSEALHCMALERLTAFGMILEACEGHCTGVFGARVHGDSLAVTDTTNMHLSWIQ